MSSNEENQMTYGSIRKLVSFILIYLAVYVIFMYCFPKNDVYSTLIRIVNIIVVNIYTILILIKSFKVRKYSKKFVLLLIALACSYEIGIAGQFFYLGKINERFESIAYYISYTSTCFLEVPIVLCLLSELRTRLDKVILGFDIGAILIFLSSYVYFMMNSTQSGLSLQILSSVFYVIINIFYMVFFYMITIKYKKVFTKENRVLILLASHMLLAQSLVGLLGTSINILNFVDFLVVIYWTILFIVIMQIDGKSLIDRNWQPLEHYFIWSSAQQLYPIVFTFLIYIYTYTFYQNKYINIWLILAILFVTLRSYFLSYNQNKVLNSFLKLNKEFNGEVENQIHNLVQAEKQYKALFHEMDIPALMLDRYGYIKSYNQEASNMANKYFSLEEVTILTDFVIKEERKDVQKKFIRALRNEIVLFDTKIMNEEEKVFSVHVKFLPIEVKGRLLGVYTLIKDITESVEALETLEKLAYEDALTGLPNRAKFYLVVKEILHYSSEQETHGVIFFDMNKFKYINDTLGHGVGDEVLVEVSKRTNQIIGEKGILCRQSGDEFLVFLPNMNRHEVGEVTKELTQTIQLPMELSNRTLKISASFGIAMYPCDGKEYDEIIGHADIAMYEVKNDPNVTYKFYDTKMQAQQERKKQIESNLKFAVERNELSLYYQPKIDVYNKKIIGVEALVRWLNPELGSVSPLEFIPVAEDTGDIIKLGQWVLETACKQWRKWEDLGFYELEMGINISQIQLEETNFVENLISVVEDYGIPPRYIDLEIMESIAMSNETLVLKKLDELYDYGFSISMDDFGKGYSSMAYLSKYSIDTLKIDRSFISNLKNDKQKKMVNIIISMALKLGLRIIAEGVETKEQKEYLLGQNCHYMQGYLFSKPNTATEIAKVFLRKEKKD